MVTPLHLLDNLSQMILECISDVIDMKLWRHFDFFFQNIVVLRTPEAANFADINDSAIMVIKKQ